MSLKEKGHKYAKCKTTMISLVAVDLEASALRTLPLEDPLLPSMSPLSKGWQPDGQWAHDPRSPPAEVAVVALPGQTCALHQPELSLHQQLVHVSEALRLSLLSLGARAGALPRR